MPGHVFGVGRGDRDAADAEVSKRVDERYRGRRRRNSPPRSRPRTHLVAGALGAEHEAARGARPHHRVRLFIREPGGAFGEPLVAAEVEQGVYRCASSPTEVITTGSRTAPSIRRLERGKVVLGAVTGIEEAYRHHAPSPWLIDTEIGRLSTMLTRGAYEVRRLASELRTEIRGTTRDDAASRGLYAVDGSNYRAVPDLVVVPADAEDLATAVALTAAAGAPVTLRGGGTSMAGNAIGGVVIDALAARQPDPRHRHHCPNRCRRTRRRAHRSARRRPATRAHVRGGPVLGQPGHHRWDDREQRLRCPLRGVGNHSGKRAVAGRAARRRHPLHRDGYRRSRRSRS